MHRRPRAQASDHIHAHHKEFYLGKNGKTYAKGHAAKYHSYLAKWHPDATHMSSRGQKGSRHDQVCEASLTLFINRPGNVEYMDEECESKSLLVDACYVNLTAVAMVALTRALGIFFLVVIEPWRFFAGTDDYNNNGEFNTADDDDDDDDEPSPPDDDEFHARHNWSPLNLAPIYDAIERALMASSLDGTFFMRPENRDIYMDALDPADRPTYRAYKSHLQSRRTRKPGGTFVAQRPEIERRVFEPDDPTDLETDDQCAEILKVMCVGFLAGLYTSKAADFFASKLGKYSVPKQTPAMKERMAGFLRTNDKGGESPIANFKYVYEMFCNIGWLAANAVATARTNHTFAITAESAASRGSYNKSTANATKPPTPVTDGAFVALGKTSVSAQDALARAARRSLLDDMRALKRTGAAQATRWAELSEVARQADLNKVKLKFKRAIIYFGKWETTFKEIKTAAQTRAAVAACPNKTRKLDFLKDFCNIGEHGLGLVSAGLIEHKPFSKKGDASVGTIEDLTAYCTDALIPAIRSHPADIPDEPPLPDIPQRFTSTLGVATSQRAALHTARVDRAVALRIQWRGEIAREGNARPARPPPQTMPDPATLEGKRIEMIMKFEIPTATEPVVELYWCPGTVRRAVKDKLQVGRKKYTHGWAEVEWDGEEPRAQRTWWQHLRQSFYEKDKYGGWGVMEDGVSRGDDAGDGGGGDSDDDGI